MSLHWMFVSRPGGEVSGTLVGHIVPGAPFLVAGLIMLLWSIRQNLKPGQTFVDKFSQFRLFPRLALTVMGASAFAFSTETISMLVQSGYYPWDHLVFACSFFIVGITMKWEHQGRLPVDTYRSSLVVSLVLQAFMMWGHAAHKPSPQDILFHSIWGYIDQAAVVVIALSVRNPESAVLWVTGWALLLLQGIWVITIGFYQCCFDIEHHNISMLLSLECLIILLSILAAVAYCGPERAQNTSSRREFELLTESADDEDELEEEKGNVI